MADDNVDFASILEGLPDDNMGEDFTTEEAHELTKWSGSLEGQSDEASVTALSTRASAEHQSTRAQRATSAQASARKDRVRVGSGGSQLSHTKLLLLREIFELAERHPEGIVSLGDIREANPGLAALIKSGKQAALHALVHTHKLVLYLKDIDPAMRSKYKLTSAGMTYCQEKRATGWPSE